jgi:hypothetical protein
MDRRARNSGRQEGNKGDAEHHLDAPDDFAVARSDHNVAVADRGDRLQGPPERRPRGGHRSNFLIAPVTPAARLICSL